MPTLLPGLGQPWAFLVVASIVVGAVIALLKAVPWFWSHLILPTATTITEVDEMSRLRPEVVELAHMAPLIKKVVTELSPNGGKSLFDKIHRIEGDVKTLKEDVAALKEKL